jgi:hypothetical protein
VVVVELGLFVGVAALVLPPQPIQLRKKVGQVKSNCHGCGPICEVSSSWGTPVAFSFEGRGPRSIQSYFLR